MKIKPFFSVIIPVHNSQDHILQAINSVLAQTLKDWELLIIDDGSVDKSYDLVCEMANLDERINVFTHGPGINKGVSATRNLGLKYAKGDWIAFLDADDIWHEKKLEIQKGIIDEGFRELVFIYCNALVFKDGDANIFDENKDKIYGAGKAGVSKDPFKWVIKKGFEAPTSSVVIKQAIINEKGILFREYLSYTEDTIFWYESIQYGNIYYINKPLAGYRIHNSQWNSSTGRELKLGRRFLIYSEMLKSNFKKEYSDLISFLYVNKGLRKILIYNLSIRTFSPGKIFYHLKIVLGENIKITYKMLSFYVLISESIIMPLRWIKYLISEK